MAGVRVTIGGLSGSKYPSRVTDTPTGMAVNTHVMSKIANLISGSELIPILEEAIQVALEEVKATWPIDTGASISTARTLIVETNDKTARVGMTIGGTPLIEHPKNPKHIDYAPYIEFNGSPGGTAAGTIARAFAVSQEEMRDIIHVGVESLLARAIA